MEVFRIETCEQGELCYNSLFHNGVGTALCGSCRFAPNNPKTYSSFWKPRNPKEKHPAAVAKKEAKKRSKLAERKEQKQQVDRSKQKVLKQAVYAERTTERNLIRATKNSGRSNRDGDHVAAGQITLDTKMQSKRSNPVVIMEQLAKVREDARNGGHALGALVLRNANNVGVVAIHEDDFARIIALLK